MVLFPQGLLANSGFWVGIVMIVVATILLLPAVIFLLPPALGLVLIVAVWAANIWSDYDRMYRQVELDVRPAELFCISFGPHGVEQHFWARERIRSLHVARRKNEDPHLCLTDQHGQRNMIAFGRRQELEEALRLLHRELALPTVQTPELTHSAPAPAATIRSKSLKAVRRIWTALIGPIGNGNGVASQDGKDVL